MNAWAKGGSYARRDRRLRSDLRVEQAIRHGDDDAANARLSATLQARRDEIRAAAEKEARNVYKRKMEAALRQERRAEARFRRHFKLPEGFLQLTLAALNQPTPEPS